MSINLDQLVSINITRATRMASVRNFGMPIIVAYATAWLDRVREYTDPSELLDDGFTDDHPAYKMAVKLCSAEERPDRFKVGRRAGAPTQSVRYTPSTPSAGEEYSITIGDVT